MNKGTYNIKNNFEPKIVHKYMHKKTHTKPVQLFTNFKLSYVYLVFMHKMPFIE